MGIGSTRLEVINPECKARRVRLPTKEVEIMLTDKELRFLRIASPSQGKVLTIVYTLRSQSEGSQKIRLISARKASKKEKLAYESEG